MGFRAGHLRFAMPASLGALKASTLSLQLGSWLRKRLAPELSVEMHVAQSYAGLTEDFRTGRVDVAWAPPYVCSAVEREGGRSVVQFERGGSTTFRAAFVCRVDAPLQLEALERVAVAWVAKESTSGYLLPRQHLERLGVDLTRALGAQLFAGSFAAALEALIDGRVALTTVFASAASATPQRTGLDTLPPGLRSQLQVIGFSDESPNDSIIASANVPAPVFELLRARLISSDEGLKAIFDADRLVAPR